MRTLRSANTSFDRVRLAGMMTFLGEALHGLEMVKKRGFDEIPLFEPVGAGVPLQPLLGFLRDDRRDLCGHPQPPLHKCRFIYINVSFDSLIRFTRESRFGTIEVGAKVFPLW